MSVDVTAKVGYGFILTNEEYCQYRDRLDALDTDPSNFCCYMNAYDDNSDIFYGITIDATDDYTPLCRLNDYDADVWKECLREWQEDFPKRANETPNYYLICNWW